MAEDTTQTGLEPATVAEIASMPKPNLRWKLDEDKSIKMTYGLLMDLQRLLPDPTQALALVMTDPYTQDYVVRRVLTDSAATITDLDKLIPAEEVNLEPEQIENLLDWVVQHILHFFARRAANLTVTGNHFKAALPSLFTLGSPTSASSTPSAGPSEPPKTE